MLYINTSPAAPARVNLRELAEVRQFHMPGPVVRFASPCELERVADEIARQRPELREETSFVVQEELWRRESLTQSPLHAMTRGQAQ